MNTAEIPMKTIGPIKIIGPQINEKVYVPLATFEAPLWNSVNRGARVSREVENGISVTLVDDRMTRSVILEADNASSALKAVREIQKRKSEMDKVVESASRFAKLLNVNFQVVGNLLYLRFEFFTADASGHNMSTHAAEHLMNWILNQYPNLQYVSISGNYCTDKKVSAVNGILGRGKYVIAEINIPRNICERVLKTTPEKIVNLNIKKNLLGSVLAGSLRSANAHFANMLLAFYLATGQDAANIIEGSQGIVRAEIQQESLYFSVTLPNIIVGTVGSGKDFPFVLKNLEMMGCLNADNSGESAKRLALIVAATVLCGELSLLAAQTNEGDLVRSHLLIERRKKGRKK